MKTQKKEIGTWWKSFKTMPDAKRGLTFPEMSDTGFTDVQEELKAWEYNLDRFHDEIRVTRGLPWLKDADYWFNKNIEILKMKIDGTYEAYSIAETKRHAADARAILQKLRSEGKIQ